MGVTPPRLDTKVIEPLTDDEIRALLATCVSPKGAAKDRRFRDVRDAALIRLMVETGLRASEVVGLALEDVHWRDDPPFLIVRTAKSRRGRTVPFSAHASMAVDRYARLRRHHALHDSPSMWLGSRGNRLSYIGLYDSLTDRAERAGIARFHPHLLQAHGRASVAGGRGERGRADERRRLVAARHADALHPRPGRAARRRGSAPAQPGGAMSRPVDREFGPRSGAGAADHYHDPTLDVGVAVNG